MASQRISTAKISGVAGQAVISQFSEWSAARDVDDPTEWRSDQWPMSIRNEVDAFCVALRNNSHRLPVINFSEHVDLWSMGDVYNRWLSPAAGQRPFEVLSDRFQAWCYPLPDDGSLAIHLQRALRRKRNWQEDRWLLLNLIEATQAWGGVSDVAALVVLREVLGGLAMDSDVAESLKQLPGWCIVLSVKAQLS